MKTFIITLLLTAPFLLSFMVRMDKFTDRLHNGFEVEILLLMQLAVSPLFLSIVFGYYVIKALNKS
jgi:hypothetical protein